MNTQNTLYKEIGMDAFENKKFVGSFNELPDGDFGQGSCGSVSMFNMSPKIPSDVIPIKEQDGFQFSFYANEPDRNNIHVCKSGELVAVFWTEPKVEVKRRGKKSCEGDVNKALKIIAANQEKFNDFINEFDKRKLPRTAISGSEGE